MNNVESESIDIDLELESLRALMEKLIPENIITARAIKYNVEKYIDSEDPREALYAISKIITDGGGLEIVPSEAELVTALEETKDELIDAIARRYVERNIESDVEKALVERQEQYMDEMRLNILKKHKGKENSKTQKKLEELKELDLRKRIKNVQKLLRPSSFEEIQGQVSPIKSIISKIASPYPQHVILYGPPGVGKTTAARLALEESKKLKYTPYDEKSKFVEVDGTTVRWDPREITNPLLGSVHDPIYQGSKRDLSDVGVPEPKPGLVTEAHGGILFIDEIGELDNILQNKLLKVLEDKRVEFSSSYYDPDDENVPDYIKYLFEHGAPADFVLIGATTRDPSEINPALRSRCAEVFFEPLSNDDIARIVKNAARKLKIKLEKGFASRISEYTIEGRKAVNILADVYGEVLYTNYNKNNDLNDITLTISDLEKVISSGRVSPIRKLSGEENFEVGHVYGLGVSGYVGSIIEIEAMAFEARERGKGKIRFNDTAGSMAKDSVFNSATVAKRVTGLNIEDYDIHINVIGGGKIDGPSAGVAITVAIISALQNKPINQNVAITGEISLRGKVKPVGGIFEKIYGANKKGIKQVIIPEDNQDLIPRALKGIKVQTASDIEDVLKVIFPEK